MHSCHKPEDLQRGGFPCIAVVNMDGRKGHLVEVCAAFLAVASEYAAISTAALTVRAAGAGYSDYKCPLSTMPQVDNSGIVPC